MYVFGPSVHLSLSFVSLEDFCDFLYSNVFTEFRFSVLC